MLEKYLDFICNNQSQELIVWAAEYESEILAKEDTTSKAWEIIWDKVLNKKEYGLAIQEIIIELLRWNKAPSCLTSTDINSIPPFLLISRQFRKNLFLTASWEISKNGGIEYK